MAGIVTTTQRQVLVIADGDDQLWTLCRGLRHMGMVCLAARTASGAGALLDRAGGGSVELLLVDFTVPCAAIERFVTELRASRPDLPVLVIAGLILSPGATALAALGTPILRKPFTPQELGRAIETLLAGSALRKEETS